MSRGVYVRGVSVQEGICPGVSVWGVHVRFFFVLSPFRFERPSVKLGSNKRNTNSVSMQRKIGVRFL